MSLLMVLTMGLALTGCGESGGNEPAAEGATYTVGICQLVQHAALDAATNGFKDALEEALPGQVEFKEQNASGDSANCGIIVNGFVSEGVDLIMANATPALQAAASATSEIPILGTSITDYQTALELESFNGTVGGNISGTSDLAPLNLQADMFKEWFPDAKTIGIMYCTAEANSKYQADEIKTHLEKLGYETLECTFTDSNDIAAAAQSACDKCDAIYIPTDNTAASNVEAIANVVLPAGVPVITGEAGSCGCGVATLSISYYELGRITGEMAAKVLTGEENISEMPIKQVENLTKMFNKANCDLLKITVPEGYTELGQ